ncbi:MAG: pirin family protein [Clostridia bacterium]
MKMRTIRKIVIGNKTQDGAGVKLVRVISRPDVEDFDPFLMLDAFDSDNPADYLKGFPWHPHRGIETVTYLISGDIEHGDSLGNKGSILDGCCQWMTAGGGILHQEMPKASKRMLGVQLWLNLPAKDKMTTPKYRDITAAMVPKIQEDGCIIGIIAGEYQGKLGATQGSHVKMTFLDVELQAGAKWELITREQDKLFIYLVAGSGWFEEARQHLLAEKQAVLFNQGEKFVAFAADQGLRFLLFAGEPLAESIAWGGPIVMNTQKELEQAFRELEEGTFIQK